MAGIEEMTGKQALNHLTTTPAKRPGSPYRAACQSVCAVAGLPAPAPVHPHRCGCPRCAGGCFGAVIVDKETGEVVGEGYNKVILHNDPTWCASRCLPALA